ncbi:ribosomal protein l30-like [Lynx pardinus]|uniref:Ribosomal protein l30-like n=1 Tax=Lynx pardinus TaxID=191816 RepID=A0A485MQ10_LYNPA|nr:ribosomal protein l30-like [Lynx pardinus]
MASKTSHPPQQLPALRKSEKGYCAMLAKTGVRHYSGNTIERGAACGRYCIVLHSSRHDPGDSDVIRSMREHTGEK